MQIASNYYHLWKDLKVKVRKEKNSKIFSKYDILDPARSAEKKWSISA